MAKILCVHVCVRVPGCFVYANMQHAAETSLWIRIHVFLKWRLKRMFASHYDFVAVLITAQAGILMVVLTRLRRRASRTWALQPRLWALQPRPSPPPRANGGAPSSRLCYLFHLSDWWIPVCKMGLYLARLITHNARLLPTMTGSQWDQLFLLIFFLVTLSAGVLASWMGDAQLGAPRSDSRIGLADSPHVPRLPTSAWIPCLSSVQKWWHRQIHHWIQLCSENSSVPEEWGRLPSLHSCLSLHILFHPIPGRGPSSLSVQCATQSWSCMLWGSGRRCVNLLHNRFCHASAECGLPP